MPPNAAGTREIWYLCANVRWSFYTMVTLGTGSDDHRFETYKHAALSNNIVCCLVPYFNKTKLKHRVTQPTQSGRVRRTHYRTTFGHHPLLPEETGGRFKGPNANMFFGFIFVPETETHVFVAFFCL